LNIINIMGGPPGVMSARYTTVEGETVEVDPLPNEAEGRFALRVSAEARAAGATTLVLGSLPRRRREFADWDGMPDE
jgi:hypothetical protein